LDFFCRRFAALTPYLLVTLRLGVEAVACSSNRASTSAAVICGRRSGLRRNFVALTPFRSLTVTPDFCRRRLNTDPPSPVEI
jgi:hypothetical protein